MDNINHPKKLEQENNLKIVLKHLGRYRHITVLLQIPPHLYKYLRRI